MGEAVWSDDFERCLRRWLEGVSSWQLPQRLLEALTLYHPHGVVVFGALEDFVGLDPDALLRRA